MARVHELVRDERPGAVRLARVMADRPRYINLVVLLRIICEITATVLLVAFFYGDLGRDWGLFAAAVIMVVISFVVIGVGPRTLGRQNAYTIALGGSASAASDLGAAGPDQPAAGGAGEHADTRSWVPQRAVRLRDRVARGRRPGPAARRGRRRRAPDDPVGVRTRRHPGPRGDGAAHRDDLDRERQDGRAGDVVGGAQRALPHPGDRRERRRHRRRGVSERPVSSRRITRPTAVATPPCPR